MPEKDSQRQQQGKEFQGFHPLDANYVYCPNQFLDLCLPNCSRGAVRIVAYILRQTLGWLDKDGQPINQEVTATYNELIRNAGVSRGAIAPAIHEAIDAGFIRCKQTGELKSKGNSGQSASYELNWSNSTDYESSFLDFDGYFTGDGYRTPIPNQFFDALINRESLSVTKVVGAVLRHTVGYQNQFGGRRSSAPLSYSQLEAYTNLDRSTLAIAIRQAIASGYIHRLEEGKFSRDRSEQRSATYAVRWLSKEQESDFSSKIQPVQFKKATRNSSKIHPEDQFKNPSSKEKKTLNKNLKQQAAASSEKAIQLLKANGFNERDAQLLVAKRGSTVIENQVKWLQHRHPKNPNALLRKAIEEDWDPPAAILEKEKRLKLRERDSQNEQESAKEEQLADERKRKRLLRKKSLLTAWQEADVRTRSDWIKLAIDKETSAMIRERIKRQEPTIESPSIQVLDVAASELGLPAVTGSSQQ